MKKTIVLFVILLGFLGTENTYAQENVPSLGMLTLKEKTWFVGNGFPIAKYDQKNADINLRLQDALKNNKLGKTITTAGYVGMGLGAIVGITGSGGSKAGVILPGALVVGSLVTTFIGTAKRRKAGRTVQEANYLLEENTN